MPQIAVAGPSNTVVNAALAVCDEGGSVVDAAVAAALTAMCTEPGVCGPGGGGFLTIDVPGHTPAVVDGYMAFPGTGFTGETNVRTVKMTYGGGVTTLVDAGSIAVPGAFAAFGLASELFGRVSFSTLMSTVADFVDGFPLSYAAHHYLTEGAAPIYDNDPSARAALFVEGMPRDLGAPITFDGLADTLREIGADGPATLYGGDLGRRIIEDLATRGSSLTLEDLERYEPIVRQPRTVMLGDWTVATNPEPAVGGVVLTDVLSRVPKDGMAGALIGAFLARHDAVRSPSTISVAAADDDGGAVAASFSAGYGSGIIPAGTGLLMNNGLGELELTGGKPGKPGERVVSNMAPTVAKHPGAIVGVGTPGADRITSALAITLWRLGKGDTIQEAIAHSRIHPEFEGGEVRMAAEPADDLDEIEVEVRLFGEQHMFFGGVNAAGLVEGELEACADHRRTGAIGYSTP